MMDETIVFDIDLGHQSEFSYLDLIKGHLKETSNNENDSDVENVMKNLEERFGKNKPEVDRGFGYDKQDSFIDDTEAYDELLPDTMGSNFGGFCINYGMLKHKLSDEHLVIKKKRVGNSVPRPSSKQLKQTQNFLSPKAMPIIDKSTQESHNILVSDVFRQLENKSTVHRMYPTPKNHPIP